jgi:hypothetical protein
MPARLAKPLLSLVDINQSAFVKGRSIKDIFFMFLYDQDKKNG